MSVLRAVSRFRTVFIIVGVLLALAGGWLGASGWLSVAGLACIGAGMVLIFLPSGSGGRAAVAVASPVRGRWIPVNSPADKVPSHGTHELGQTYAIDLVYAPEPAQEWKAIVPGFLPARADAFPAFGQPIHAPADGVVVQASGRQRDHRARNTWPALAYLMVEGMVFRALGSLLTLSGGRFVLGNHVVVDHGDGVYGVFAHLRRGSVAVRRGERVTAGQVLGQVGNSGNSSEPHLHFHLSDTPRHLVAAGIPFTWEYAEEDADGTRGPVRTGVPGGRRPFHADAPAGAAAQDSGEGAGAQPGIG
ncbi:M23 family metallopeptidase [Actinomadura flavalba]|uniref:M23 family metallopeptidase n=1 Tax=Actinomadura flavalba TaxID=1120938 RepID=UPI000375E86F|nr:M23 family metallopeptidase [Actinomadura flavalba]